MSDGDAVGQLEWGADRDGEFADARLIRVPQLRRNEFALRFNLDHGDVGFGVGAFDGGVVFLSVFEPDVTKVLSAPSTTWLFVRM